MNSSNVDIGFAKELLISFSEVLTREQPLVRQPIPWHLHAFERVSSTMDVARTPQSSPSEFEFFRIENCKKEAPKIIVAREQVSGRGQHDRKWLSSSNSGLYVTYVIAPEVSATLLSGFSLIVGLAVVRTIEGFGVSCGLKWPNDVVCELAESLNKTSSYFNVGGKRFGKIAGVLVESSASGERVKTLSVGIGANLFANEALAQVGGVSLEENIPHSGSGERTKIQLSLFLAELSRNFASVSGEYLSGGLKPFIKEWSERSVLIGHEVRVTLGAKSRVVLVRGIDLKGGLIVSDLESPEQNTVVYSGEVESIDVASN